MVKESPHQTNYTRQIQYLLAKVYKQSAMKDSLLDHAVDYFEDETFQSSDFPEEETELEQDARTKRYDALMAIALSILDLAEGTNIHEANKKSAQFLGTIQLLSPTEGARVAMNNEISKTAYKAVICLRMLDKLVIDGQVKDPYVKKYLKNLSPEQYTAFTDTKAEDYKRFTAQVKIPLVIAALLQDIGHYHPDAREILVGNDKKKDPFRILEPEERKELLQISYKATIKYLNEGVGLPAFVGNTKAERERFNSDEQDKLFFINQLLKTSAKPKNSIGNLLKVPQIYTSIVLSTKPNYNYKLLPQVFQVLNKSSEVGACSQADVDALYKVVGMFPQGFGIVFMPHGDFVEQGDCYEYAIVNSLYPEIPEIPSCRMATRKLTFIGYGQNIDIPRNKNLYFTNTAKRLAQVSKERLNEILELLSSNFKERKELDLLPRCWYANDYFSVKTNQNLWNVVSDEDE